MKANSNTNTVEVEKVIKVMEKETTFNPELSQAEFTVLFAILGNINASANVNGVRPAKMWDEMARIAKLNGFDSRSEEYKDISNTFDGIFFIGSFS